MSDFDFTKEMTALDSDEVRLAIPVPEFLHEASALVAFVRGHVDADKKLGTLGLGSAKVTGAFADEMQALVAQTVDANADYDVAIKGKAGGARIDRARFVVDEMHAALTYLFDDGVADDDDERLANIVAIHKDDADSPAYLAVELDEYAKIAEPHAKELDGLGGFDVAMIAEAKKLADEIRATPIAPPSADETAKLAKRNRLLQLLDKRVRKVRAAAKFVFRAHPEIAKQVASPYERKHRIVAKRAATRRKNAETANPQPAQPIPAPHA